MRNHYITPPTRNLRTQHPTTKDNTYPKRVKSKPGKETRKRKLSYKMRLKT